MTVPIDITDPKFAKAYAHPLRVQILGLLDGRIASPREIADELGTPLSNTSYHVRQLASLGLVELVGRRARRGAIEHHYTARIRPTITNEGWARLPRIVKGELLAGGMQQAISHMAQAAEQGGFDREDVHFSRTTGKLDEAGWTAIARELKRTLSRIDEIFNETTARLEDDGSAAVVDTTILMAHFEGPAPDQIPERRPGSPASARGKHSPAGFDIDHLA